MTSKANHLTAVDNAVLSAPLTGEEFAELMKNLPAQKFVRCAVAVSGGPDSMALAHCLRQWRGEKNLVAFIVDHQLRPGSAAEAATVQQRLADIGIAAEILRWDHAPVTKHLHLAARKARYALLAAACRRHDIADLFLAHHQDDQAETILMRFAKGSGIDGLAGMAAAANHDNIRLLRPFLTVPKARLFATCAAANLAFVTDASNTAARFARGRLRRVMPLLEAEGLTPDRLTDLGHRAREAKDALDYYTAAFLRVACRADLAGCLHIDLEQLRSAPRATALRALSAALQSIHAGDYPPERAALLPLLEALCHDTPMPPRTLHGCLVTRGKSSVTILREWNAVTETLQLAPGQSVVWDNRWQVTLAAAADRPLTVRALGLQPHAHLDHLSPALRRHIPQGRARAALPALWADDALILIPSLPYETNSLAKAHCLLSA